MNTKLKLSVTPTRSQLILGWVMAIVYNWGLPYAMAWLGAQNPGKLNLFWLNVICWGVGFWLLFLVLHRYLIASFKRVKLDFWETVQAVILGFVLYWVLSNVAGWLYTALAPTFTNINNEAVSGMTQRKPAIMAVMTILIVPISEECIYRGLIFAPLAGVNYYLAIAVSALLFAFSHVVGFIGVYDPLTMVLCVIQYLPASIALAWTHGKADTIWASVALHSVINAIATGFTLFAG